MAKSPAAQPIHMTPREANTTHEHILTLPRDNFDSRESWIALDVNEVTLGSGGACVILNAVDFQRLIDWYNTGREA